MLSELQVSGWYLSINQRHRQSPPVAIKNADFQKKKKERKQKIEEVRNKMIGHQLKVEKKGWKV